MEKIPDSGPAKTTSAMMVPVKEEGRVVGVVQLMTDRGLYSEADLDLFDGLVAQMGAAVRNARLQQERRRLEAAEAAARAVAREREQAAHVLEAVGDGIFLLDRQESSGSGTPAPRYLRALGGRGSGRKLVDVVSSSAALADRVEVAAQDAMARPLTLPVEVGGQTCSFVAVRITDGVVYAFRDVTAETWLEEENGLRRDDLARRCARR